VWHLSLLLAVRPESLGKTAVLTLLAFFSQSFSAVGRRGTSFASGNGGYENLAASAFRTKAW
jgi:hypothetical protein